MQGKVVKCYIMPLPRLSHIYWLIYFNNKADNQNKFSFEPVALSGIVKELTDINPNKSSTKDSIPPKILKITSEATAKILQKPLNKSLETSTFPDSLKLADIAPTFKRKDPLDKTIYRPVSVLRMSKLFEKITPKQVNGFISNCYHPIYVVTEKVITRNRLC